MRVRVLQIPIQKRNKIITRRWVPRKRKEKTAGRIKYRGDMRVIRGPG